MAATTIGWAEASAVGRRPRGASRLAIPLSRIPDYGTGILAHENRDLLEAWVRGEPLGSMALREITLDATTRCNANCLSCIDEDTREAACHTAFAIRSLLTLVRRLPELGVKIVKLYGGEPTCYRGLEQVLNALAALGVHVFMSSNGYLLHRFLCTLARLRESVEVRVSLNAGTAETHQRIFRTRRPWFETILANLRALSERGVAVSASLVVRPETIGEIARATRRVRDAGGRQMTIKPLVSPSTKTLELLPEHLKDAALGDIGEAVALQDGAFRVAVSETMHEVLAARTAEDLVQPKPAGFRCAFTAFRAVVSPPEPGVVTSCPYHRGSASFVVGRDVARLGAEWLASRERQEGIERPDFQTECTFHCDRGAIALYLDAVKRRYPTEGEQVLAEVPILPARSGYFV